MSISPSFDTGALRIRLKTAEDKVKAFESGEKYVQMQEQFKAAFREQNARIRKLEEELGKAHAQTVSVRKIWSGIFDDVYREADAGKAVLRKEIARLLQRVLEVERQRDAALDRLRDKNHELYEVKSALYEAEQKIAGLTARINKDHTNSSKPSSQNPNHKTIPNGREKSGKKPGGQKGHIHHGRKRMEPTQVTHFLTSPLPLTLLIMDINNGHIKVRHPYSECPPPVLNHTRLFFTVMHIKLPCNKHEPPYKPFKKFIVKSAILHA